MRHKRQRHEKIIRLVRERSFMPVEALASELDVTPQTIRRDIGELCADGLLQRYHGGATLGDAALNDTYLLQKKNGSRMKKPISLI